MTQSAAVPDLVVVPESGLQRDGLYGFLTLAFVAALIRGVLGAGTAGGRAAAGLVLGCVVALVVAAWVRAIRRPDRLEVSSAAIRYVSGSGAPAKELSRQDGGELRFVARRAGRLVFPALSQSGGSMVPGGSGTMPLRMFGRRQVRRACESRGWQFAPPTR